MVRVLEKVERRLGEKLLLKGERCAGPKCAVVRRAYPPGRHGKKRSRRRGASEYGALLMEKQKIRFLYGLDDNDLLRYSREAASKPGIFSSVFLRLLEERLDNVVFRLGFAPARRMARQMVSHGHVVVNGRVITIPSYQVKKGDRISIKEKSLASPLFAELEARLKKYETPPWLSLDAGKKTGEVTGIPAVEDAGVSVDVPKLKEFYSR